MAESLARTSVSSGIAAALGGLCGGAVVWVGQGHSLTIVPEQISYPDLIAALLTGIGLVLSVIGLAVAFIAIYGFRHFEKTAKSIATNRAKTIAVERLQSFLSGDEASVLIKVQVRALVTEILANQGAYAAWSREESAEAVKMDELDKSEG